MNGAAGLVEILYRRSGCLLQRRKDESAWRRAGVVAGETEGTVREEATWTVMRYRLAIPHEGEDVSTDPQGEQVIESR